MTGSAASSGERYSGPVQLLVELAPELDAEAMRLVEQRLAAFVQGIAAGYFFPGALVGSAPAPERSDASLLLADFEVVDRPVTAFGVLGGVLADCQHHDVAFQSAVATLGTRMRSLLTESTERPAAADNPPFKVEFPDDLAGNDALLVEIEFARDVPAEVGAQLLEELALWEVLALAYPPDPEEEMEVGGAQRHFNDPRTIHHHEWICEAEPEAWNLLVNLCCAWSRRERVVRLHIE